VSLPRPQQVRDRTGKAIESRGNYEIKLLVASADCRPWDRARVRPIDVSPPLSGADYQDHGCTRPRDDNPRWKTIGSAWAHVFKIQGGQLHEIEAMGGIDLLLDTNSGWDGPASNVAR